MAGNARASVSQWPVGIDHSIATVRLCSPIFVYRSSHCNRREGTLLSFDSYSLIIFQIDVNECSVFRMSYLRLWQPNACYRPHRFSARLHGDYTFAVRSPAEQWNSRRLVTAFENDPFSLRSFSVPMKPEKVYIACPRSGRRWNEAARVLLAERPFLCCFRPPGTFPDVNVTPAYHDTQCGTADEFVFAVG